MPVDVELPPLPDATLDDYLRAVMDAAIARIRER